MRRLMKSVIVFTRTLLFTLSIPAFMVGIATIYLLFIGYRPYIATSPSMEPRYPEGSFCLVDTVLSIEDLKENDVIVYAEGSSLIMHRMISFDPPYAEMKGDANNNSQIVELDNKTFVGRLLWSAPRFGKMVDKLISGPWLWIAVGVLVIMSCLPYREIDLRTTASPSTAPSPSTEEHKDEQINTQEV